MCVLCSGEITKNFAVPKEFQTLILTNKSMTKVKKKMQNASLMFVCLVITSRYFTRRATIVTFPKIKILLEPFNLF